MSQPDAARWVVISLLVGGGFVVGLNLFIQHKVATARAQALAETGAEVRKRESRGVPLLDAAAAVASPFVAHLAAGRFAEAHALLAADYRSVVSVEAFARSCRASPILTRSRSVMLNRLRQQSAGAGTTIEASGVLDTASGAVPIGFVFLQEAGALRVLVVSLGGVPVLQGVAPVAPAPEAPPPARTRLRHGGLEK